MTRDEAATIVRKYDLLADEILDIGLAVIMGIREPHELRTEYRAKLDAYKSMRNDKFHADYILTFTH